MIYLTDTDTDTLIRYMLHTGYCVDTIFEHGKQHVNMVTGQVFVWQGSRLFCEPRTLPSRP